MKGYKTTMMALHCSAVSLISAALCFNGDASYSGKPYIGGTAAVVLLANSQNLLPMPQDSACITLICIQ
jgi:hypothetical protein